MSFLVDCFLKLVNNTYLLVIDKYPNILKYIPEKIPFICFPLTWNPQCYTKQYNILSSLRHCYGLNYVLQKGVEVLTPVTVTVALFRNGLL